MGCFNATCMISNLPIQYGDKIKLILLRPYYGMDRMYQSGGYVYSCDILTPSFLPITGTYNDYGMIENIEKDWNYSVIELTLKKILGHSIKVGNKTLEKYTLVDILDGISTNDLWYNGVNPDDVKRKKLAEDACKAYGEHGYSSESVKKEWESLLNLDVSEKERKLNLSFVMIREDIWTHIIDNYVGEFYNPDSSDKSNIYISAKEFCKYEYDLNKKTLFSRHYAGDVSLYEPKFYNSVLNIADKKMKNMIFTDWMQFTIINSYISSTRKGWMIQPGMGSQHDGWRDYILLSEKIIEICNNKLKE